MANHISRSSEPVYVGNYLAPTTRPPPPMLLLPVFRCSPTSCWLAPLSTLVNLSFSPWSASLFGFLERFCQRQHGCDSPLTPRPPSSIRFIKGELRPEQVLFMSCPLPASIQQLWHPRERVGRTPESDFLSAGEVAQHPDSSRGEK